MIYKSLFILGRLPAIGRAELESLYGGAHLAAAGDNAMLSDMPAHDIDFARLGGSIKVAEVVATINSCDWRAVQQACSQQTVALAGKLAGGKVQLGISVYGLPVNTRQLLAAGLELKKTLRSRQYSVRLVPNQELALSSAQVLHNHLTGERGIELLAVAAGAQTIIARTTAVQDISAYAARDQGRPKRDAFVGMLPPKLAQTIVNLAAAQTKPQAETVILDPFCGTGVVLQEALLMGFGAYGTDLEPRMVTYTEQNLAWLQNLQNRPVSGAIHHSENRLYTVEAGDATAHQWQPVPQIVASETYLGRPLSGWPKPDTLRSIIGACTVIIEKFLRNIGGQLPTGARLCLAVPAWRAPNGQLHHLPLLDLLNEMGYNRVSFEHAREEQLVYYRPDQLVARELLVITRN